MENPASFIKKAFQNHPMVAWGATSFFSFGLVIGVIAVWSQGQHPWWIVIPSNAELWLGIFAGGYLVFEIAQLATVNDAKQATQLAVLKAARLEAKKRQVEFLGGMCDDLVDPDYAKVVKVDWIWLYRYLGLIRLMLDALLDTSPELAISINKFRGDIERYKPRLLNPDLWDTSSKHAEMLDKIAVFKHNLSQFLKNQNHGN